MSPLANTFLQLAPLRRAERDRNGRIIGLERAGLLRKPTGKGVTANYHWPLDPVESSPFLTYLGLQDILGLVFLRGAEYLIDKVSN